MHTVADDGTIQTWNVRWSGDEAPLLLAQNRAARLRELRAKYPGRVWQGTSEGEGEYVKGFISNRESNFIHFQDAQGEYNWIKRILIERGDWHVQQEFLVLEDGDRVKWSDLFEEPGIYRWQA
jgi:hypothetical protein